MDLFFVFWLLALAVFSLFESFGTPKNRRNR